MSDERGQYTGGTERYDDWKSQIRSELKAFEGGGPPSAKELWNVAATEARSTADWIDDMPLTDGEIKTAKGDVLKVLVALEMAEDRLSKENNPDHKPASSLRDDESVLGGDFEI